MNVGQKVWYVPQRGYSLNAPGREYVVIKVGRKWITTADPNAGHEFNNIRVGIDQHNASQEGYNARDRRGDYVGRLFVDQQHEKYATDRHAAWEKLSRAFRTVCPHRVTLMDIKSMALTMEVDLSEPNSVQHYTLL